MYFFKAHCQLKLQYILYYFSQKKKDYSLMSERNIVNMLKTINTKIRTKDIKTTTK